MAIGTITYGTVSTSTTTNGTITPAIPGAADAGDILLCFAFDRAPITFSETGLGTWTSLFNGTGCTSITCAVFWAAGDEAVAPTLSWTGNATPVAAVVVRVEGGTGAGSVGTLFQTGTGTNDYSVGPIDVPTLLNDADGVVFCMAGHRNVAGSGVATSSSITAASTGTWVQGLEFYTTVGNDMSTTIFHNIYTAAPTLADETVTFAGGVSEGGQCGIMVEVTGDIAAGQPTRRRFGGVQFCNNLVIPRQGKAIW